MENTKKELKKHADLIKKFVLTEAEKVRATYADIGGNCFYPTTKKPGNVNEDDGITAKIVVCDTCKKEPCECEKIEEHYSTGTVIASLKEISGLLNKCDPRTMGSVNEHLVQTALAKIDILLRNM